MQNSGPRQLTKSERRELAAAARTQVLSEARLLGDPLAMRSEAIDHITDLITRELDVASSRASIVTQDDQRYLGATNLTPGVEDANAVDHDRSFCQFVAADREELVVDDTRDHETTRDSKAIEDLDARAYAGVPLVTPDGVSLGALCAIDNQPHEWTERDLDLLRRLANWVVMEVEFRRSMSRLEQVGRQRDDLLATIVHELHTPLASVVGSARLLQHDYEAMEPDVRVRLIGLILRQGERVTRLTSDLHVLAQLDSGMLPTVDVDVWLPAAVRDAVVDSGVDDETTRVEIPDVYVHADQDRVGQVFVNLLTNAHKYGRPPISVHGTVVGDRVEIRVADEGSGVPEGFLASLFDRFSRAPETAATVSGSGLGLAIVREFLREMGGDVRHEPSESGTCFVVDLPIAGHGRPT